MFRYAILLMVASLAGCGSLPAGKGSYQISQPAYDRYIHPLLASVSPVLGKALQENVSITDNSEPETGLNNQYDNLKAIINNSHDESFKPDNNFTSLYKVIYGNTNQASADFASLLAEFMVKNDFACKNPAMAAYFRIRYHYGQSVDGQCSASLPLLLITRINGPVIVWVKPRQIHSIHLVFAGKSDALASMFGHVAVRLVVCPEEDATPARCNENIFGHIVLGFQAHVDEFSLNTWKALNGDYRAYLFASSFMDTYQEYAIEEFREIYSVPLILSESEKNDLFRKLVNIHWSFSGSYNFFTNNCSQMLQKTFNEIWPSFMKSEEMKAEFVRPDRFFEAMKTTSLLESDRISSLTEAEKEGYYFGSTRDFYDRAVSVVSGALSVSFFDSLEGYLHVNPVVRRNIIESDAQYIKKLRDDAYIREAQLMLEEYAITSINRNFMIEGARFLEQQDFLGRENKILARLDEEHSKVFNECMLYPLKLHASPVKRVSGIPGNAEMPEFYNPLMSCQATQNVKLLNEAIAEINFANSDQWQKLKILSQYWHQSISNLDWLKQIH